VVQFFEPISTLRRETENKLINYFKSRGYKEIVTSLFSYEDSIFEGLFEPLKRQLFKIVDKNSGQTMVLRADITMQITQAIIISDMEMPVRVCYADNIYRDVTQHSGKKREFRQTGVELFGIKGLDADSEVIDIAINALKNLSIDGLRVKIADTYLINRLLASCGVEEKNVVEEIRKQISFKNLDLLQKTLPDLPKEVTEGLRILRKQSGYYDQEKDYAPVKGLADELLELANGIHNTHPDVKLFVDFFYCEYPLYHHGIVFDLFSDGTQLAVGGRYGNVTKPFGRYIPATGFAINLDELTYFLAQKENKE